jgi:UDP-N-acetylmuramate-alanine ligase
MSIYYYPTYEQITEHASKMLKDGDLFITIGAGKANSIGKALVEKAEK